MRIKFVHENGQVFQSSNEEPDDKNATVEDVADVFYNTFEDLEKLKFELEGGGMIVIGKEAIQRGALLVTPD